MDRNYENVSRSILAMAVIAPAFIATRVAAKRGWEYQLLQYKLFGGNGYNNWDGYNGYNSWTYGYGYDIQVGTIIMAIMTITTIIITGIIDLWL